MKPEVHNHVHKSPFEKCVGIDTELRLGELLFASENPDARGIQFCVSCALVGDGKTISFLRYLLFLTYCLTVLQQTVLLTSVK
jgi:hypothetical protein